MPRFRAPNLNIYSFNFFLNRKLSGLPVPFAETLEHERQAYRSARNTP